jgi:hypothetical protein
MRVVSMASATVMSGRIVVSRRANIDLPAPGGPSINRLWPERLHYFQLRFCIAQLTRAVLQVPTEGRAKAEKPSRKPLRGTFAISSAAAVKGVSMLATTRAMSAIAVRETSPLDAGRQPPPPSGVHRVGVQVGG